MPQLTRRRTIKEPYGMQCDCCGKVDEIGLNDFLLNHTMGYDSPLDMATISAAVCDHCLFELVVKSIPGARIVTHEGHDVSREQALAILDERASPKKPG